MVPVPDLSTVTVAPPAYQRAQAKAQPALHLDALTLVTRLHLLALYRLAVRLAQRRCPPPLPAGPGGHPRVYSEASLLLIALLRTLWRLSYQDMCDWLRSWSAAYPLCLPTVETGAGCRRSGRRGVAHPGSADRHSVSTDWRTRSHHRQRSHPGVVAT